jgi:hypothetical protein
MDCREEVARQLVEARGDTSEVLQLVEEAFDEVTSPVDIPVDAALDLSVALRGDMSASAPASGKINQCLGVVSPVGDEIARSDQTGDQGYGCLLVRGLPGGQDDPNGQTFPIDHHIDLRAQSSTRTANGVIRAPFFPPAACW